MDFLRVYFGDSCMILWHVHRKICNLILGSQLHLYLTDCLIDELGRLFEDKTDIQSQRVHTILVRVNVSELGLNSVQSYAET